MLIDTHIHLQDRQYKQDTLKVLDRAANSGITALVVPGTNLPDSLHAIKLAEKYSQHQCQVYAAIGIHPTETHRLTDKVIDELRDLASHDRVVAVGEIGLDYYWPNNKNRSWQCADPVTQRQAFEAQLMLATDLSLPVIVHDRDAHNDTLSMLTTWHESNTVNHGVLHSYSCGVDKLKEVIDLGFYISLSGPVTYKNAKDLRQVSKSIRSDRLLVETDGPYLTPIPHRGKRNEPQYLHLISDRIAMERNMTPVELADMTTRNAIKLFNLNINPDEDILH